MDHRRRGGHASTPQAQVRAIHAAARSRRTAGQGPHACPNHRGPVCRHRRAVHALRLVDDEGNSHRQLRPPLDWQHAIPAASGIRPRAPLRRAKEVSRRQGTGEATCRSFTRRACTAQDRELAQDAEPEPRRRRFFQRLGRAAKPRNTRVRLSSYRDTTSAARSTRDAQGGPSALGAGRWRLLSSSRVDFAFPNIL